MIAAMGLKREQVYIANIVKCRPPGNRTPERDECETCSPFLMRQIGVIRPKVIVALGATAAKNLLERERLDGLAARALLRLFTAAASPTDPDEPFRVQAGGHLSSGVSVARSAAEEGSLERFADGDALSRPAHAASARPKAA